jgi:hypothetical protein
MLQTQTWVRPSQAHRAVHPVVAYPRTTIYLAVVVALILLMVML